MSKNPGEGGISNMVGIICPPDENRVNMSDKIAPPVPTALPFGAYYKLTFFSCAKVLAIFNPTGGSARLNHVLVSYHKEYAWHISHILLG